MKRTVPIVALVALSVGIANAAPEQEHFFDSNGVKIRYWLEGEGEPVLLIHGYSTNGSLNWRAPGIQQDLSKSYQVIMPDVRNHGRSEQVPDGEHGVKVVEDMVRLLDHLNIESAYVAGYSMGGMITLKMTTMFPDRVRSALVCGMGWIEADTEETRGYAQNETTGRLGPPARGFGELATTKEEVQAITLPVKVIVGTDDSGQMRRVKAWKAIVPNLDVLYVEGADHSGCVFRPELKEGIREFIDMQASNR